ncbi:MAG TPA: DUF1501 domain-containing protein [Thermoanaerobaculia bacterium]|jgi:uncharacterized protein (DUF1501 family)|nr:DUF1501 domain-containing protein [Thermoanaerobaculia bacterium]
MSDKRNDTPAGAEGLSRRQFLRGSVCSAVGMTSLFATAFDLRRVAAATAAAALDGDFKALVCVFLYGGNDSNNVLVPRGTSAYNAYAAARGSLALPLASLRPITPLSGGGGQTWGLHPSLPGLQNLFGQQHLALVANVGPLVAPVTKSEYDAGTAALPPQLFSHSDQTVHWQTALPDQPVHSGWGGRVADLLHSLNTGSQVSMSMSLGGSNTFQVGSSVTQYQLSSEGSIGLGWYYDGNEWIDPASIAIRQLMAKSYGNVFQRGYRDVFERALDQDRLLSGALAAAPALTTVFPDTDLGSQLRMIARLISIRETLGHRRQVYFCATGGYDLHDGQIGGTAQVGPHADLLTELDGSLSAFYAATVELGVANSVTAFTASDFGRTYKSNGEGSDHGWGAHHLVLGGAVTGGRFYGTVPTLAVDGPDDSGDGRWIPTTSVDEYSATLAKWFGVSATDLPLVFPNLGRFDTPDMGFLV